MTTLCIWNITGSIQTMDCTRKSCANTNNTLLSLLECPSFVTMTTTVNQARKAEAKNIQRTKKRHLQNIAYNMIEAVATYGLQYKALIYNTLL